MCRRPHYPNHCMYHTWGWDNTNVAHFQVYLQNEKAHLYPSDIGERISFLSYFVADLLLFLWKQVWPMPSEVFFVASGNSLYAYLTFAGDLSLQLPGGVGPPNDYASHVRVPEVGMQCFLFFLLIFPICGSRYFCTCQCGAQKGAL